MRRSTIRAAGVACLLFLASCAIARKLAPDEVDVSGYENGNTYEHYVPVYTFNKKTESLVLIHTRRQVKKSLQYAHTSNFWFRHLQGALAFRWYF